MALKRLFQLVAKAESQPGTAASGLASAANAAFLVSDPQFTWNPEIFSRANINRASISPLQNLAGVVTGNVTFGIELAGGGADPAFGLLLRGCGMREYATNAMQIGAITSGPFYHGETITASVSGATGTVMHDTYTGASHILYSPGTGTPLTGQTWTGGTSGATATASSALWSYGKTWAPYSIETSSCTVGSLASGAPTAGDIMQGATSGALAIVIGTWAATTGNQFRYLDGTFTSGETLTNLTSSGDNAANCTAFDQDYIPSISFGVIEDGTIKAMKGARGSFSISGNVGEPMLFNFNFTGIKTANTDTGTLSGVTYTSVVPPVLLGATLSVGDDAITAEASEAGPRFQSISLDFGNTTGIGRDAGEATGLYGSSHITSRAPTGSIGMNVEPEAVYDFREKLTSGDPTRMRLKIGSTDEKFFQFSSPSLVFTGESGGDQEGIATRDMPFDIASISPAGTDVDDAELVITYGQDVAP